MGILLKRLQIGFYFEKEAWWTGWDLNPWLQRCQRCDRSRLIYPPIDILNQTRKLLSIMGEKETTISTY
jgi:hypothetical protein